MDGIRIYEIIVSDWNSGSIMGKVEHEHELEFHSEDTRTVESDDYEPSKKDRHFEFTNNHNIMRLLRLFIFIQVIAIMGKRNCCA